MEKINKKNMLIKCGAILLIIVYIVLMCPIDIQNDIFFDIKQGEDYVVNGINTVDKFSIHDNLKYVSHHFMVNIITYIVYNLTGLTGIYILEIILTIMLSFLFYKANKIYVKNSIVAYFMIFLEIFFIREFISQRAQMYSYLLFLLEIICIEKFLRKSKKGYLIMLSIIPLLIVNFHAGVLPFYFIIIFVYLLNYINIKFRRFENEECFKKNLKYLIIPVVVGFGLMFLNPFGIDGIIYSFKTVSNKFITNNIVEFQPSNIYNNILFYMYLLLIAFTYIVSNKKIKTHQIALILGTSFMSMISARHFSLLVIVSVTNMDIFEDVIKSFYNKLKKGVEEKKVEKFKKSIIAILLFYTIVIAFINFAQMEKNLLPNKLYAIDGVEYIKNNIGKDKRIFNEYFWGSLMMLNDMKVFIDSRCDLYTEEYNPQTTVANDWIDALNCNKNYDSIFKKYNIEYVFIRKDSNLNEFLKDDNRYTLKYSDEVSVIYEVNS